MSSDEFLHALMRLQFGLSASFHFLFVPLSIGLLLCMNILQTAHVLTKHPALQQAARFWGRFFLLVWATGVLTGYPLRWQLTDLWSHYIQDAAPVLKGIFAIEAWLAPWMIGLVFTVTCLRAVLPAVALMVAGWLLWGLLGCQALTILSVNAWMQDPSGVPQEAGIWQLTSLSQVILSDTAIHEVFHTLSAAMLSGAFFVFAVTSHFISQGRHLPASRASLRVASWVGLMAALSVFLSGHLSALGVAKVQPMKFAAFEAHWKADAGPAALVLWAWPDEAHGLNHQEIAVPYLLSALSSEDMSAPPGITDLTQDIERKLTNRWLARPAAAPAMAGLDRSLQWPGRDEQRAWLRLRESVALRQGTHWDTLSQQEQISQVALAARPPVKAVFFAFRVMVASGLLCLGLCTAVFIMRDSLLAGRSARLLKLMRWALPLPWLAILSGWAVAEIGRQPWTIYEHLPTFHASSLPSIESGVLTFFMMLMAGLVIATTFALVARSIFRAGPEAEHWLDLGPAQRWAEESWLSLVAR